MPARVAIRHQVVSFEFPKDTSMAYDEELADRVRRIFADRSVAFEEKPMMGGLCFMVDGKMCIGVVKIRLMARIDPEIYHEALGRKGCVPMDFTGKPMRGFVFVNAEGIDDSAIWNRGWTSHSNSIRGLCPPRKSRQCRSLSHARPEIDQRLAGPDEQCANERCCSATLSSLLPRTGKTNAQLLWQSCSVEGGNRAAAFRFHCRLGTSRCHGCAHAEMPGVSRGVHCGCHRFGNIVYHGFVCANGCHSLVLEFSFRNVLRSHRKATPHRSRALFPLTPATDVVIRNLPAELSDGSSTSGYSGQCLANVPVRRKSALNINRTMPDSSIT